jgi:hypothetical protein
LSGINALCRNSAAQRVCNPECISVFAGWDFIINISSCRTRVRHIAKLERIGAQFVNTYRCRRYAVYCKFIKVKTIHLHCLIGVQGETEFYFFTQITGKVNVFFYPGGLYTIVYRYCIVLVLISPDRIHAA